MLLRYKHEKQQTTAGKFVFKCFVLNFWKIATYTFIIVINRRKEIIKVAEIKMTCYWVQFSNLTHCINWVKGLPSGTNKKRKTYAK